MHAAGLIEALRRGTGNWELGTGNREQGAEPEVQFMGLGGDKMVAAGAHLYQDYRQMAYMGFVAVVKNLDKVRENFRIAREALLRERPDVLILIDYPSFNLKMAEFCRKHLPETKIVYYIPPKIWAWKKWRVHKIARLCDKVLGIFPFEPEFYRQYGYECTYVGNPTAEQVRGKREKGKGNWERGTGSWELGTGKRERVIGILPGSRRSEIEHCLGKMLEAARRIEGYRIEVCQAPGIEAEMYEQYLRKGETLVRDNYGLMSRAEAAIVNSGTATLETALCDCPQVAVYHLAIPKWIIDTFRRFVFSIKHFTLVNILGVRSGYIHENERGFGDGIIQEMIAYRFTADEIEQELRRILTDEAYKKNMLAGYEHIREILGNQDAAETAARIICDW